jgi:hypothetical protein
MQDYSLHSHPRPTKDNRFSYLLRPLPAFGASRSSFSFASFAKSGSFLITSYSTAVSNRREGQNWKRGGQNSETRTRPLPVWRRLPSSSTQLFTER